MKQFKVGLIGCGEWAKIAYLSAIEVSSDFEIVSLSGIFPTELGEKIRAKLGIGRYFEKWENMLEDKDLNLDLVIISTPHKFHYEQTKLALIRGINVHVDKPPAIILKKLQVLIKIAKKIMSHSQFIRK